MILLQQLWAPNQSHLKSEALKWFLSDDAIQITSELYDSLAQKSHLHNKKKKDLTESTGVVPAEYTPKVKLELFSQL